MSCYSRGRSFEYTVRRHLIKCGAENVQRSPMSRGPWDVRADVTGPAGDVTTLYVQCKSTQSGYVCPEEWNALVDYAESRGGLPLIAHKTAAGRVCFKVIEGRKSGRKRQPWNEYEL